MPFSSENLSLISWPRIPTSFSPATPCDFQVNKYYDLVTSFYEYGWESRSILRPGWKGEPLKESIKQHEHFLALQGDDTVKWLRTFTWTMLCYCLLTCL
ncbi:unnamed protein product [Camellia sinensis]